MRRFQRSGDPSISISQDVVTRLMALSALFVIVLFLAVVSVEAQAEPDFEWKVAITTSITGYEQFVESVEYDEATGDTYLIWNNREIFSGKYAQEAISLARVDPEQMELDNCATFRYPGFPRYHVVHDGIWYLFSMVETRNNRYDIHLRVDGVDTDRRVWRTLSIIDVLGVHENNIMMVTRDRTRDDIWALHSIDLETFESTSVLLFDIKGNGHGWRLTMRDGIVYCVFYTSTPDYQQDYVELHTYEIGSLELEEPVLLCYWDYVRSSRVKFDVDSQGNIHLLMQSNSTLMKFHPSGILMASTQIGSLVVEEGTSWFGANIIVNGADQVNVVGILMYDTSLTSVYMSVTLSSTYDSEVITATISEDYEGSGGYILEINGSDRIFLGLSNTIDTNNRAAISFQIDPTPDLSISARYLRVEERPLSEEPVEMSILIRNVGRAPCSSFTVSVYHKPLGYDTYTLVLQELVTHQLPGGDSVWFTEDARIPKGNCMLRFEVHNVTPYENYRYNNVIEVPTYIATNNPPEIQVHSPPNGTFCDDILVVSGSTNDLDNDPNVTTTIWGLPGINLTIDGEGDWNLSIDLDGVPSGTYVIRFRASDGTDDSITVSREIIVDHLEDGLILGGHYPDVDVHLLTGQSETFVLNVTDRFSRNLTFEWRSDDDVVGSAMPYHHYSASRVGSFVLTVRVTNGRSTLSHIWNITVRDPITPSITSWDPEGPIVLPKGSEVELSFTVDNPDDVVITFVWYVNNAPAPGEGDLTRTFVFPDPTSTTIKAMIVHGWGSDEVSWDIDIRNQPPEIIGWTPSDYHIDSIGPITIEFIVEVVDTDDAILGYTWSSINITIPSVGGNSTRVEFTDVGSYHISLQVTDGIDTEHIDWTIVVLENEPSVTEPDSEVLPWIILLMVGLVTVVIYALMRPGTTGDDNDEGGHD